MLNKLNKLDKLNKLNNRRGFPSSWPSAILIGIIIVWRELRKFIADTVDKLGDQFRPVLKAAWLAYIQEVYPVEGGQDLEAPMTWSVLLEEDNYEPCHPPAAAKIYYEPVLFRSVQ